MWLSDTGGQNAPLLDELAVFRLPPFSWAV